MRRRWAVVVEKVSIKVTKYQAIRLLFCYFHIVGESHEMKIGSCGGGGIYKSY